MRCLCLLVLALLLCGCDSPAPAPTPAPTPTPTPAPRPTPTPAFSADEARYVQTVRAQLDVYMPRLVRVGALVPTPVPLATALPGIRQRLELYREWDTRAQKVVAPPRFASLHERYLTGLHHIALYANLEDQIVSTFSDTSAIQAQADVEFAQGLTDLQEVAAALPTTPSPP
jgi:hypothetical protein